MAGSVAVDLSGDCAYVELYILIHDHMSCRLINPYQCLLIHVEAAPCGLEWIELCEAS